MSDTNNINFERHRKIVELGKFGGEIRWEKGRLLFEQKKTDGWKGLAETWQSYLADPEMGESLQSLERHIRVYAFYGEKLGLKYKDVQGIDVKKLEKIKRVADKKNYREWLGKARSLSWSDLVRIIDYGEVKNCPHKHIKNLPPRYRCEDCGEVFLTKPE